MLNVTREMFIQVLDGYIELAKKLKGEVVVLNRVKDEDDEVIISKIEDFKLIKTRFGDLLEVTIYVNDEDEVYEEFKIGNGSDYKKVQETILSKLPKTKNKYNIKINTEIEKEKPKQRNSQKLSENHFQKFMKK
ncbi:hypothetical protein [uncultured Cetobacterium sp.]|uniref:hypothetical protein n=1 Tax=uncultured Cetobacterium sp. TaxID=527638 RepID=UPI00261A0F24|nr:hypothetical protein [uncultured Cetobacterium sp.]